MKDLFGQEYNTGCAVLDEAYMHIIGRLIEITGSNKGGIEQKVQIITQVDHNQRDQVLLVGEHGCYTSCKLTYNVQSKTILVLRNTVDENGHLIMEPIRQFGSTGTEVAQATRTIIAIMFDEWMNAYDAVAEAMKEEEDRERKDKIKMVIPNQV